MGITHSETTKISGKEFESKAEALHEAKLYAEDLIKKDGKHFVIFIDIEERDDGTFVLYQNLEVRKDNE